MGNAQEGRAGGEDASAWGFDGSGPRPTPTSQIARPSVANDRRSKAARIMALADGSKPAVGWLATGGGRGGKVGRQAQLRPQSYKRVGLLNGDADMEVGEGLRVEQDRQHLPGQPQWRRLAIVGHAFEAPYGACAAGSLRTCSTACETSHQCAAAGWLGFRGSHSSRRHLAGRQRSRGGSSPKPQVFGEGMQHAT